MNKMLRCLLIITAFSAVSLKAMDEERRSLLSDYDKGSQGNIDPRFQTREKYNAWINWIQQPSKYNRQNLPIEWVGKNDLQIRQQTAEMLGFKSPEALNSYNDKFSKKK